METHYRDSGLQMPGGSEVEAATLHVRVGQEHEPRGAHARRGSLKETMMTKVRDAKTGLADETARMRSRAGRSMSAMQAELRRSAESATRSLEARARNGMQRVQSSMRTSPMKWAGIAAGTGFGFGLIGRVMHWRNRHRRVMPSLIVIEKSC
jgi:ElaB/YqjD/DUF883 family membrane-anchored ribosome-binding protein